MKYKFQTIVDIPNEAAYGRVKKKLEAMGEVISLSIADNCKFNSYPHIMFDGEKWIGCGYIKKNSISYKEFIKKNFTEIKVKVDKLPENMVNNGLLKTLIHSSNCTEWKNDITSIVKANFLRKDDELYSIPDEFITKFQGRGSVDQKEAVADLGIVVVRRSPFKNEFHAKDITDVSERLFGDANILQIGNSAVPDELKHLKGRSFYIDEKIDVILHKGENKSTIIEFKFK